MRAFYHLRYSEPMSRLLLILAVLTAACEAGPLACNGPSDCGGNACCLDFGIGYKGTTNVYCTGAPDACRPVQTVDSVITRMCTRDADCTAGGISTTANRCCASTVANHYAGTCDGLCNRGPYSP